MQRKTILERIRGIFANPQDKKLSQEQTEWERAMLEQAFAPSKDKRHTVSRNARTYATLNRRKPDATAAPEAKPKLNTSRSTRTIRLTKDVFTHQSATSDETSTDTPRAGKRF